MKNEFLSLNESAIAAMNIQSIETQLGHKLPAGYIDVTSLTDDIMSPEEAYVTAMNIQSIESMRRASSNTSLAYDIISTLGIIGVLGFVMILAFIG